MKSPRQVLLQVLEEKYTTQRHIQESLQGRIMELTAQLELQLHARPATTPPSTDSESHTSAHVAATRLAALDRRHRRRRRVKATMICCGINEGLICLVLTLPLSVLYKASYPRHDTVDCVCSCGVVCAMRQE